LESAGREEKATEMNGDEQRERIYCIGASCNTEGAHKEKTSRAGLDQHQGGDTKREKNLKNSEAKYEA